MGIFNMMIVLPMLLNGLTFGWIYQHLLALIRATRWLLQAPCCCARRP
jgi:hypothetical protein